MDPKWVLNDAYKRFTLDQDKIKSPQETVAEVKKRFSQLNLNILDKTVRIDSGRLDIPVFFSVCGPDAKNLTGTAKQMGKGATPAQAEASAVVELLERFSFYSFAANADNFISGTHKDIGEEALAFRDIARSVHDPSEDLDAARRVFERLQLKWTRAYNLSRNHSVLVPFDWFFAINEFNGTSAGNCLEEALCQGICEIVERHVSALVCRDRIAVPGIDPDSADDPMVREMMDKYRRNGIQVYVSDFTLDMGIPSVGVLAYDPQTFPEQSEIVWTAGTAPDPNKAFSRALTEVAQLAGDFNSGSNYVASGLPKYTALDAADYITKPRSCKSIAELPDISDNNIKTEVERCILALSQKSMDVISIDTTHSGLAIPALYSMIPGAHFRERAAAGSVGMFSAKLITEKYPPEKAVEELLQIDSLLPDKYYVHFYLGKAHLELEKMDQALAYFEKALELNPDTQDIPSIFSYIGHTFKEMGEFEKALANAEKGLSYDDERTDLHNLAGFSYFKLRQHEAAIASFSRVIELNPASAIDYANLATNYREIGDTETAIAYYRVAVDLDPSIEFARENLERLTQGHP